jgi:two-component system nitrate/nitrite response regulator NarL
VKLHVKSILRKLGIHSRVEAAVIAVEQGLRTTSRSND